MAATVSAWISGALMGGGPVSTLAANLALRNKVARVAPTESKEASVTLMRVAEAARLFSLTDDSFPTCSRIVGASCGFRWTLDRQHLSIGDCISAAQASALPGSPAVTNRFSGDGALDSDEGWSALAISSMRSSDAERPELMPVSGGVADVAACSHYLPGMCRK